MEPMNAQLNEIDNKSMSKSLPTILVACGAVFLGVFATTDVSAEIKASAKDGFHVNLEVEVTVDRKIAYDAFVSDLAKWWDGSHSYSSDAKNLSMDLKQKCMLERLPNGGFVRHMEIVYLQPGKMLRMTGGLGPLQGMGATGALNISFSESEGKTTVRLNYVVHGPSFQNFDKMAKPVEGVLAGQMNRFKKYCNSLGEKKSAAKKSDQNANQDRAEFARAIAKAAKILKYEQGVWDCTWDYLDSTGKVVRTVRGVERMKYTLNKRVLEMETYLDERLVSRSFRFYNPVSKKLTLLSVGMDGNHWEMEQDLDSDVMVSQPHRMRNGNTETIRFTTTEKTDDAMTVVMERTVDNKNWTKVFRQTLKRQKN